MKYYDLYVFPQDKETEVHGKYQRRGGMTVRDYFAGQIVPSLLQNTTLLKTAIESAQNPEGVKSTDMNVGVFGNILATMAYALADEIMKYRSKDEER